MTHILVVNAGSSSMKYQLIESYSGARVATGLVERIGEASGLIDHRSGGERIEATGAYPDHTAGFSAMIAAFDASGTPLSEYTIAAVGHRVVQGGDAFVAPTLIDDAVQQKIADLSHLAPLHNPGEHQAIVAARRVFSSVPHVAVFDTAFHQTMPPEAYTYAIDPDLAERYGIRRYGFHGTSHSIVSRRAAECVGRPVEELRQIVLHLGNGASICAIAGGRSVNTSMGFTPLEGLVMGTRSGDLDPSIPLFLMREAGLTVDEVDELLNTRSGLYGFTGSNDMRDVRAKADAGDERAALALRVTAARIRHYIGAYLVQLGGADTIVFTAGIGENHPRFRAEVLADLEWFGIELSKVRNNNARDDARVISTNTSRVQVLVVPTDEEWEIARQTADLVQALR